MYPFCSGNTTMHSACIAVELHVTVNYIKVLNIARCSYGKFMSPTTKQIIHTWCQNKLYSN